MVIRKQIGTGQVESAIFHQIPFNMRTCRPSHDIKAYWSACPSPEETFRLHCGYKGIQVFRKKFSLGCTEIFRTSKGRGCLNQARDIEGDIGRNSLLKLKQGAIHAPV